LVDSTDTKDVDIHQHPRCAVDVQDSSHARNNREMVNVMPIIQKTSEKAQKREKDVIEVLVPSTAERKEKDQISDAPAATKSNVSPSAAIPTAALVPSMPSKPQQKQPPKAIAVAKQSGPVQLSPRRPKPAPEKTADPKTGDKEVKGGSSAEKAKIVGAATTDLNPYDLEGAIDGLLEVWGSGGQRSLQKQKKAAKTGDDEGVAIPTDEAPSKVSSKDKKVSERAPNPQGKKLVVFNVHGTLLDCSLLLDKNPNTSIRPTLRTATRRVIFRPCFIDFLTRCFVHFEVAFWGSKSEVYMDDIVPVMLGRMKEGSTFKPLFVWSGKECEVTKFEDGIPLEWRKPLCKIFWWYPLIEKEGFYDWRNN
jgi:hypothetical protein